MSVCGSAGGWLRRLAPGAYNRVASFEAADRQWTERSGSDLKKWESSCRSTNTSVRSAARYSRNSSRSRTGTSHTSVPDAVRRRGGVSFRPFPPGAAVRPSRAGRADAGDFPEASPVAPCGRLICASPLALEAITTTAGCESARPFCVALRVPARTPAEECDMATSCPIWYNDLAESLTGVRGLSPE